jgi:hypothetical protein
MNDDDENQAPGWGELLREHHGRHDVIQMSAKSTDQVGEVAAFVSSAAIKQKQASRKAKAARGKYLLAERVADLEKLIACLSLYYHRLEPCNPTPAKPIEDFIREKKAFRPYAQAARRVLHVFAVWDKSTGDLNFRLPTESCLCTRLAGVGLNIRIPSERKQFDELNSDLEIDDQVRAFTARHPQLLQRVQLFLRRDYIPPAEELLKELGGPAHRKVHKAKLPPEESWTPAHGPAEKNAINPVGGPVPHLGAPATPDPFQFDPGSIGAALKSQHLSRG